MHWNGRSWAAIAGPDLNLGSGQWLVGGNIVASGPHNVWVDYAIQAEGSSTSTGLLLHWDGTSWHRTAVPLAPNGVWSMARDGRGGLWLTAEGSSPVGVNWYFYHFSRRRLTLVAVPARRGSTQLFGAGHLAWIPGTTSLWEIETLSSGARFSGRDPQIRRLNCYDWPTAVTFRTRGVVICFRSRQGRRYERVQGDRHHRDQQHLVGGRRRRGG